MTSHVRWATDKYIVASCDKFIPHLSLELAFVRVIIVSFHNTLCSVGRSICMLILVSNCSIIDAADQPFRASVAISQVVDNVSALWNAALVITAAVTIVQLVDASLSYCFLAKRYQHIEHKTPKKRESVDRCNRSIPDPDIHKMSFPTNRQQQDQQRRTSTDMAASSANTLAAVMTSYCGTWSSRPAHHHVRFSSTIEVLPPGSLLVSTQQQNVASKHCAGGGSRCVGGVVCDPLTTFPSVGTRYLLPAESKV